MRAVIQDNDALAAITPAALAAYVRAEGWNRIESYGDHSDVYARDGATELILPGTSQLADYTVVLSEILQRLAAFEERDEMALYRDLIVSDKDVIRVRAPEADDDGSIRIEAGVELVLHARDLLLSAACSAREPRAMYRAGKIKDATQYMDRVRLGQTEQGSFVIALLAPVPPSFDDLQQPAFWPEIVEEPFERRVTRTLSSSLKASKRAAEGVVRGGGVEAFRAAIPRGVSANSCDALAALITKGEGLEVSVTWARTRLAPIAREVVKFNESEAEIFAEAARRFKSLEPRPDEQLSGYVIALDRKPDDQTGKITLKTFLDGIPVSVTTTLSPELYSEAISAHDSKEAITISGDLVRQGQRWTLENPRNLSVAPEEELR